MNKYNIDVLNEEVSRLEIIGANGTRIVKNVGTKSLLNSFSLEQKLISFNYISPGVVKHRKQGAKYDIAVVLPAVKVEGSNGFMWLPATMVLISTDQSFSRINKVELYQMIGFGYRGPNTEVCKYPYNVPREIFGVSLVPNVFDFLNAKLQDFALNCIKQEVIPVFNGNVKVKEYMKAHEGSFMLAEKYTQQEKLGANSIFSHF